MLRMRHASLSLVNSQRVSACIGAETALKGSPFAAATNAPLDSHLPSFFSGSIVASQFAPLFIICSSHNTRPLSSSLTCTHPSIIVSISFKAIFFFFRHADESISRKSKIMMFRRWRDFTLFNALPRGNGIYIESTGGMKREVRRRRHKVFVKVDEQSVG